MRKRERRSWIVAVAMVACLAFPAGASGAAVFGADLTQAPDTDLGGMVGNPIGGVTVTDTAGGAETGSPIAGVLVSVRIRSSGDASPAMTVRVLRETGMFTYLNLAPEIPLPLPASMAAQVTQATGLHHPIGVGDRLGLSYTKTMDLGVAAASAMASTRLPDMAHPPGTSIGYGTAEGKELLVQGTVEPDADGDTFGDETQDGCPTSAATQGACPQPVVQPPGKTPVKKKCKRKKRKGGAAAAKKRCKRKRK